MPITLPDNLGHRLAPFAMQLGLSVEELAGQFLNDWLSWKEAEAALKDAVEGSSSVVLDAQLLALVRRKLGLGTSVPEVTPAGTTLRHAFLTDLELVTRRVGREDPAASEALIRDVEETVGVLRWLPEVGEPPAGPTDIPSGIRRTSLKTFRDYDLYYREASGVCDLLRPLKRPAPACPMIS